MEKLIPLAGILILTSLTFFLSNNRKKIDYRLVIWGLLLQISLGLLVLGIPALDLHGPLRFIFNGLNDAVVALLNFTLEGSRFIFGDLVDSSKVGFIFAFQVLPTIIFISSLTAVLYHLGLMQIMVKGIAHLMQKTMGISGAESLATAANIFVGQTEAPLLIKPYISSMTRSELFTLMVGGMATVAGGVLAAYVGLLHERIPDIAGHLLTASVMSAPAAIMIAKIMFPEVGKPLTMGSVPTNNTTQEDQHTNTIEAAAQGASEGLKLALNVAAMLLAFIALIALINGILGLIGQLIDLPQLSFQMILGWIFAPLAFIMGIPWSESLQAGALLGEKVVLNEFVAYLHLSENATQLSDRTVVILSYALCGFANFSSIAIQIGGIGSLAPDRRKDLAELGIKAVIGGSIACFLTGAVAGLLV